VEASEPKPRTPGPPTFASDQNLSRSASILQLLGRRYTPADSVAHSTYGNHLAEESPERPIPIVDPRLDPHTMMGRYEDNTSHTSFRDEEDYSRRIWRVTNPTDSDSLHSIDRGMRT